MVHVLSPQREGIGAALGHALGGFLGGNITRRQQREEQDRQFQLQNHQQQQQLSMQNMQRQHEMSSLHQALSQAGQDPQSQLQAILTAPISPEAKKLAVDSIINQQKLGQGQEDLGIKRQTVAQGQEKLNLNKQKLEQTQKMLDQVFGSKGVQQEQEQGFNPSNLSDEQIARISAVDPNLAKVLENQKRNSPEFLREQQLTKSQAAQDIKYNQQVQDLAKTHVIKEGTLNRLEQLNKKGVTGKPYERLLEKTGLVSLTSEGRREFAAEVKNLITDIRQILGSQFTGFEFQTILNAYPSADFSKEANSAIIKNLKDFEAIKDKEIEVAKKLKNENRGKIPYDFQSRVNDEVQKFAQSKLNDIKENSKKIMNEQYGVKKGEVLMLDPEGNPLVVPKNDIERLIELGASLP